MFFFTRLYLQLARSEDCVETVGGGHNPERVDEASATEWEHRPAAQFNKNGEFVVLFETSKVLITKASISLALVSPARPSRDTR